MRLIDISTPTYPNTFTMVDDADYEWLNQWKWCLNKPNGYVVRAGKDNIRLFMHVEILQPPPGMLGDHRFGNKLDNRRENLRVCTLTENNRNRGPCGGRSLPKGVYWEPKRQRFTAQIKVNKRLINLGRFLTVTEAESARIEASIKYHGEFACINQ